MAAPAGGAWRSKTAAAAKSALATTGTSSGPAKRPEGSRPGLQPGIVALSGAEKQPVDERMLFVASVLIGHTVQVQVKSGAIYEGIFHALRPAGGDFDVLLRMARLARDPSAADGDNGSQRVKPAPVMAIQGVELVQLTAVDVRMGASDVGSHGSAWDDAGGFGTDAAISRARGSWGRERELQRWAPDEGDGSQLLQLEESVGPVSRGWDQFAVNEAKFGVRTDYQEELYTTELDPSKSKISVAEAARIAAEIERGDHSALANIHMLEERGVAIDDSQMDEEDRYGAVVRDAAPSSAPGGATSANGSSAAAAAAAPRPNAWAQGRPRPLMPGAAPSAPISIDARREANKLRMQMTAAVKQTSPYGTPNKRASPLSSPLISDPSKFEALNLNPGVPRVGEDVLREFEQFKAQEAASKGGDMFKKQDIQELRQFSQKIESKLSRSLGNDSNMPAQSPSAAAAAAAVAAATSPAAEAAGASAHQGVAPGAKPAAAAAGGSEQGAAAGAEAPKKSGLNPFAKSFNFNPNAKEFKPTFTAPAAAAPAAAKPSTAAGSAPAGPGPDGAGAPPAALPAAAGPAGPSAGPPPVGPSGFKGPASPLRGPGPMQPSIPMPDMRPDFRRMPRGDMDGPGPGPGAPHPPRPERDSSFGRGRRDESRERGPGSFDRRRDGRHFEGGPGMRPDGGPPPPPPGKGPGGPQGMQMMVGPGGQPMMLPPGMMPMPGMVPVMMAPGMAGGPGQPMFMVRPMGPGQPGMVPMMQGQMLPPGMMMVPPGAMAGGSPGQRPMMVPQGMQMMMMPPGAMGMGPGMMMPPGGGPGPGGPGGKAEERGD